MEEEGILFTEKEECYFVYELTMNQRPQTGIVACASIDDYLNGVIKKHENTRALFHHNFFVLFSVLIPLSLRKLLYDVHQR